MVLRQYAAIMPRLGFTVLDIGAGIGDYAIWAVARGAHVIAYECDRFCYPALQHNAEQFGFSVMAMRVTSLAELPNADLIKLDIEGGEFDLCEWHRYPRIIMEYHEPYGSVQCLQARLEQFGFQVVSFPNKRRSDIGILAAWRDEQRSQRIAIT